MVCVCVVLVSARVWILIFCLAKKQVVNLITFDRLPRVCVCVCSHGCVFMFGASIAEEHIFPAQIEKCRAHRSVSEDASNGREGKIPNRMHLRSSRCSRCVLQHTPAFETLRLREFSSFISRIIICQKRRETEISIFDRFSLRVGTT